MRIYRLQQGIEEIFRGLKQELGGVGPLVHGRKPVPKGIVHRHWRRGKVLGHLALGLVAYGLIEEMAHRLKLSFYQCRRKLIAGRLTLDLSPLLDGL